MKVIWAPAALRDLDAIFTYISRDNSTAALKTVTTIEQGCARLEVLPHRGQPSRMPGKRDLILAPLPYIAVYRVTEAAVIILRIYHHAQHWP